MEVSMNVLAGTLALITLFVFDAGAQTPPVGIIDFYGIRNVSPDLVQKTVGIEKGDIPSQKQLDDARHRLEAIPAIAAARVINNCCEQGKGILYVGIQEKRFPSFQYRPAPRGTTKFSNDITLAWREFDEAVRNAVLAGDAEDDYSQGHSLMKNVRGRAIQEKFIGFAARDETQLRKVLHESANAEQRAIAAAVIAYGADKRKVAGDLLFAISDSDEEVRNNAIRALIPIVMLAERKPTLSIKISAEPFVEMLNSVTWTDRNKSVYLLSQLTQSRDSKVLDQLRKKAMPSLIEMAEWQSKGHAVSAFLILGRIVGIPDKEIIDSFYRDERAKIISAARSIK
jgi:hypothetical protein